MAAMAEPPTGSIASALARAGELLRRDPRLAQIQAEEILAAAPGDPRAETLLAAARRRLGDFKGARAILEPLSVRQPRAAQVHCEWGLTLVQLSEPTAALAALHRAVALKRDLPEAWRAIGDLLTQAGETDRADLAFAEMIRASVEDPALMAAGRGRPLRRRRLAVAEALLRDHLKSFPTDVAAMRMLAEAGTRLGRYSDVEALLDRCLELAPSFFAARYNLAVVLFRQQRPGDALPHLARLLAEAPADANCLNLRAACLSMIGDYDGALELYRGLLARNPGQPRTWLSFGHSLKTAGRREEGVAAYRRAIAGMPSLGEAYWSLANLKTRPFTGSEEAAMKAQIAHAGLSAEDRLHFHYALGKALEDRGEWAPAMEHYVEGARLRREERPYDAEETSVAVRRAMALFTSEFLAERANAGSQYEGPIFVVGLPRSGSTLIEQILASHSQVEGTIELPEIVALSRALNRPGSNVAGAEYPAVLGELADADFARLGNTFIDRTAVYRRLRRPFFIDKMPNNFLHIGLIKLILPRAKIIDARRHPMWPPAFRCSSSISPAARTSPTIWPTSAGTTVTTWRPWRTSTKSCRARSIG